ncbi:hypothetical protein EVAR_9079_1 [Eumeta japonica]|uniref:Uncharacterized protein n=1 Tax=Eumeta variegata TaxID=151549 RepID=A0A4C1TW48_EUMVA|nr:hypothetical protein EVAR_9079_1 [Eumeta japonica]
MLDCQQAMLDGDSCQIVSSPSRWTGVRLRDDRFVTTLGAVCRSVHGWYRANLKRRSEILLSSPADTDSDRLNGKVTGRFVYSNAIYYSGHPASLI